MRCFVKERKREEDPIRGSLAPWVSYGFPMICSIDVWKFGNGKGSFFLYSYHRDPLNSMGFSHDFLVFDEKNLRLDVAVWKWMDRWFFSDIMG